MDGIREWAIPNGRTPWRSSGRGSAGKHPPRAIATPVPGAWREEVLSWSCRCAFIHEAHGGAIACGPEIRMRGTGTPVSLVVSPCAVHVAHSRQVGSIRPTAAAEPWPQPARHSTCHRLEDSGLIETGCIGCRRRLSGKAARHERCQLHRRLPRIARSSARGHRSDGARSTRFPARQSPEPTTGRGRLT